MEIPLILATLYVASCFIVVGFQFALIAGAPWGHLTQGGRCIGRLDPVGRVGAAVAIPVFMMTSLTAAGATGMWGLELPRWTLWLGLTVQSVTFVLNWFSHMPPERKLWGPYSTIQLSLMSLLVLATD